MKNNILTILKKELSRFLGDKRLLFSTVLLPGLMIYFLYTFMGSAISSMYSPDESTPVVAIVHTPDSLGAVLQSQFDLRSAENENLDTLKKQIEDNELTALIVFPENFDELVAAYDSTVSADAPQIEITYNNADSTSQTVYRTVTSILDQYESSLANKFDVLPINMATDSESSAMIFSSMLPMLLMIFLFTGCMSVAPESIAGEKERGTIATLLITPVKRSQIAIGKICALSIVALLSGISSATGTLLSMPKLMGAASDGMNLNIYTVSDYALLGIVILSTVLFLVAIISIVSAFAKTIKEAQSYVTPLMIISMLVGITAMFGDGAKQEAFYYLIPLYNSVQCMSGILSFQIQPMNVLIAVLANLVYTGVSVFLLTKMFNSERIIFSR